MAMTPRGRMRLELRATLGGPRNTRYAYTMLWPSFACRARGYAACFLCAGSPCASLPRHSQERIGTEQTAPSSSKPAEHEPATGVPVGFGSCCFSHVPDRLLGEEGSLTGSDYHLHEAVRAGHERIDVSSTEWSRTGIESANCLSRCHLCNEDQCSCKVRFAGGTRSSSDRLSHVSRDCRDHGEGRE